MNQKLSDWASIAEILSGIAVVITLIVLIVGIRENTDSVRSSTYADSLDRLNDFQMEVLVDPDALRLWDALNSADASGLDGLDSQRLTIIVLTLFRILENSYFAARHGLLGEEESKRIEVAICRFFPRAQAAGREAVLQEVMTNEFMEHIKASCSVREQ